MVWVRAVGYLTWVSYGLDVCVPSKSICCRPNPGVHVFGGGAPKEVSKVKIRSYGWGPHPVGLVP